MNGLVERYLALGVIVHLVMYSMYCTSTVVDGVFRCNLLIMDRPYIHPEQKLYHNMPQSQVIRFARSDSNYQNFCKGEWSLRTSFHAHIPYIPYGRYVLAFPFLRQSREGSRK